MQEEPARAKPVDSKRRFATLAGVSILILAAMVAYMLTRGEPEYRAEAQLSFHGDVGLGSPMKYSMVSATSLATTALNDDELARMASRYELFAGEKEPDGKQETAARVRAHLVLLEPAPGALTVAFLDPNGEKSVSVANAAAMTLAAYQVSVHPASPALRGNGEDPALAGLAASPPQGSAASADGTGAAAEMDMAALVRQRNRIDDALQDLATARNGLSIELGNVQSKKVALAGVAQNAQAAAPDPAVEAARAQRAGLEQQLGNERAKLQDLKQRYTEQYPDVQQEEEKVSALQGRVAQLPPLPRPARASAPSSGGTAEMEHLNAEESRLENDLRRMDAAIAGEQARRRRVSAAMAMTGTPQTGAAAVRPNRSVGETVADRAGPRKEEARKVLAQLAPEPEVLMVSPFQLVQRASVSIRQGPTRQTQWIYFGLAATLLLVLCFVPLVPARRVAVSTAADVIENVPEHVAYLGDVRRMER